MPTVDLTENRQGELRATNIAIVILAVTFLGLRLCARCMMTRIGMGKDDYVILVALVSSTLCCIWHSRIKDVYLVVFIYCCSFSLVRYRNSHPRPHA